MEKSDRHHLSGKSPSLQKGIAEERREQGFLIDFKEKPTI